MSIADGASVGKVKDGFRASILAKKNGLLTTSSDAGGVNNI